VKRNSVSQRGAAFAESLIMLPVFMIIFFGVMYLKDSVVAAEVNLSRARDCAWEYSNNACPKGGDDYTRKMGCTIDPGDSAFSNTPDKLFVTNEGGGGNAGTSSTPTCPKVGSDSPASTGKSADPSQESGICTKLRESQTKGEGQTSGKGGDLRAKTGNFLDMVADIFENERHTVAASSELTPPKILGSKRTTVSAAFRVSCNTKQQGILDYIGDLLSAVNPF
jgi:hypothetical protein